MSLKNKNALITGSARGLGKEMAVVLAKQGCNVIINDIEPMKEEALKTVSEITALGVKAEFIAADVSNFESCKKMAEEIKAKFGKLDILVNNAGITKDRTLKKMTPEEWNPVININLNSLYNVTHNVLELIPEGGRVINISSIAGISGNFGQTNYASTKAGVIGFTKSLAKEVGKMKITVNAVAPGFIKSAMTDKVPMEMLAQILQLIPLREIGQPTDVANAVKFLASEDAKYISGTVIKVDGGISF
ncbi:MAG: beta-ketoacyl-ACP reductase [Nanoarchaeota archaeon]|nr:beta-ketoacyl-ACP reductase [Nanoarchaeota archaeon]MBU1004631.1 beta-ketoacyl-ACP reductase [Nanoarchaeota archaeon]MBU1946185.1 beta-ketoacyl-ACP reductase [Nanoarchaeota archaeon]